MIAYFPSKSVSTPLVVPSIITLTPGRAPYSSETVPEIVFVCAKLICTTNARNSVKIPLNFVFILLLFELFDFKNLK